jgi:putative CocE/NonD family hydrolase
MKFSPFLLPGLLALAAVAAPAQPESPLGKSYAKHEYMIPVRDGCNLFTAVYTPKDTTKDYPFLIVRTPYGVGPYGEDRYPERLGPSARFDSAGFIFVEQDVRGCYMSEGTFVNMTPHIAHKSSSSDVDESTDTYDTIDWLLKHIPHNNGRAGMWGVSYPGFYTSAGAINAHPALKAISPQAPIADWFIGDDVHHNGAFFLIDNFRFSSGFDRVRTERTTVAHEGYAFHTPDGYAFFLHAGPAASFNKRYFNDQVPFWDSMMVHSTYDYYWQARNILPHLRHMPPSVLVVGGWFDAEDLYGTLHTYQAIERQDSASRVSFVMGPWEHGGWEWRKGEKLGQVEFRQETAVFFRDSIELPFFIRTLKDGETPAPKRWMFETGSDVWRTYPSWPPHNSTPLDLYLGRNGHIDTTVRATSGDYDEFISDPSKPVPYGPWIINWRPSDYLDADQRFASRRTDVLVYETPPLDRAVTAVGPVEVHLSVSTSATDCDWVVKLIDVYPDSSTTTDDKSYEFKMTGYQMLVRGDIMPSRFRHGFLHPEAMTPGKVTDIGFAMADINHCFLPGHRIMVQVQSSWFPLVERNPQTFVSPHLADNASMRISTQRVYHGSHLTIHSLRR